MTDRDRITPNKDMRHDRREDGLNNQSPAANRANQEAASRPPVDAEHALDDRGHMTATPQEGSSYQPLRSGSYEDRQRADDSNYVIDQGAAARSGDQHMTSRQRGPGQHGDAIRESQSAPGGGSVFQPLAADPRNLEESEQGQHRGNPAAQKQQGLGGGRSYDRRDADPRGMAPDPQGRRP
ncbi:MAG: hypothetical protein ACKO01_05865 [Erythrobacter sp.]